VCLWKLTLATQKRYSKNRTVEVPSELSDLWAESTWLATDTVQRETVAPPVLERREIQGSLSVCVFLKSALFSYVQSC